MLFILRLFLARILSALVLLKRRLFPIPLSDEFSVAEVNAILTQLLLDHVGQGDLTTELGVAACKSKGRQCPATYAANHYSKMVRTIPYLQSALPPAPSSDVAQN